MGAETFGTFVSRTPQTATPAAAFSRAVQDARWENGHGGYTGTIAEKDKFVAISTVETVEIARAVAKQLIDNDDPRIDDKWGPAGCIVVGDLGFLFFGWASS